MPLINIKEVNENIHLAVWEITEDLATLESEVVLSGEDKIIYSEITHAEKALEFLAGRMLCYQAFKKLSIPYKPIYRNRFGKPEVPDSSYRISLSHTAAFVVLIIGNGIEVGVDIERPHEKMRKIAPRILNEMELAICDQNLIHYSKMWSAKEVLYKIYMKREIDFRQHLFLKPLNQEWTAMEGAIIKMPFKKICNLRFVNLQEYFICYNID